MARDDRPAPLPLMTIGALARRGGMSIAAIRRFEAQGLIYSAGRSPANYRLFDDSALWCIAMIRGLRSLGLTIHEVGQLGAVYLAQPEQPPGPLLAALLERVEARIDARLDELHAIRRRIRAFRGANAAALAGVAGAELAPDPRRARRPALDSPPGVRP